LLPFRKTIWPCGERQMKSCLLASSRALTIDGGPCGAPAMDPGPTFSCVWRRQAFTRHMFGLFLNPETMFFVIWCGLLIGAVSGLFTGGFVGLLSGLLFGLLLGIMTDVPGGLAAEIIEAGKNRLLEHLHLIEGHAKQKAHLLHRGWASFLTFEQHELASGEPQRSRDGCGCDGRF
jgi:hypothetical protein